MVGVVCYTVLLSLLTTLLGYWVNEQAEHRTWEALLQGEMAHWLQRGAQDKHWEDTDAVRAFGRAVDKPIPAVFASLPPGVHDELIFDGKVYAVLVEGIGKDRTVLALDISEMERQERTLFLTMAIFSALLVSGLGGLTYMGAKWLVEPLTRLSDTIGNLRPGVRHQRVVIRGSDPVETTVIGQALNEYLHSSEKFVEREHSFLNMASHELRTPITVVAGAAEVAAEQPSIELARPHLSRILRTSHSMQDLVTLLLVLARDPGRLRSSATSVNLADLVHRVALDHEYLLEGKELKLAFGAMPSREMVLPVPVAQAAIGNLVRNAIENSSRGTIRVSLDASDTLVIEDPGSGMTEEELARLQVQLARAGGRQGDGIGLDLIARLCDHLGWRLEFDMSVTGGTIARLQLTEVLSVKSEGQFRDREHGVVEVSLTA
ncbi:sensor histidine kinase [Steroidobacter denitrificans]|uniref:sensor histidine kinase n=1 Tax=Steroidobacter denitrificans TaxID=465721 RepID=UPI00143AA493|nr:HAMP domain-containing sensor histidine kinase [Steroidobacter denitrificans]